MMKKIFVLGCVFAILQSPPTLFAQVFADEGKGQIIQKDLDVAIVLSIYRWGSNNAEGATIRLQYDMLSCQYLSNTPEPIDSTYTHYVIGMPRYESIRLTFEQQQKIQEFIKPIFLNSFMYINRLTDPNTYSDNAYVVQLRINGLLYFETFGLPDIPYFTEFIRYIIGITSSKGLRIEMD